MGIIYLLRNYADGNLLLYYLYFFALHFIGVLYFWKLHRKVFKRKPGGRTAVFLALVGMGFGQIYNRQLKKSLFVILTIGTLMIIASLKAFEIDGNVWQFMILGLVTLTLFDAGFSSNTAKRRIILDERKQELQGKINKVLTYRQDNYEFGVDTNILMHEPDLLVYLLEKESIPLHVSMSVFKELDGLKKNNDPLTRKRAQFAFDVIEEYQRKGLLKIVNTPSFTELKSRGLNDTADDKIIGTYLKENHKGKQKLVFLSNDKGARIIARNVGLPVVEL